MTAIMNAVMGKETPRVEYVPQTAVGNAYLEAVALAQAYGVEPMPWQVYSLKATMGEAGKGKWACPVASLSVSRQNGKGEYLIMRELYGLLVLKEKIIHTAHEVKTSLDHFRRMKEGFFENDAYPDLKAMVKSISNTNGSEAIFLRNGASIRFMSRSKSSGRGFKCDLLVLDEAQELTDVQHAALQGTLTTSKHPQQILTGTPPGPGINGEVFPRMRKAGVEQSNDRQVWLEWSADKKADLLDPIVWAQANPGLGITIDIQTLEDFYGTASVETFGREHLGMWDGIGTTTVIDMDLWAELKVTKEELKELSKTPIALAIDVDWNREKATLALSGYIGENTYYQVLENAAGTDWILPMVQELRGRRDVVAIVIDEGSQAASLLPDFAVARIPVMKTGSRDMARAFGDFTDKVKQKKARHSGQAGLDNSLTNARTRKISTGGQGWDTNNIHSDITPANAITLAGYGLSVNRKPVQKRPPTKPKVIVYG